MLNRADFRKQLQEGLNAVFGLEYTRYPEEYRAVFDVENSTKAYEEDLLEVGFGEAPEKPEGESVQFDEAGESWVARYYHITVALAFAITEEAEEDGLYGSIGAKMSRALARSLQHTKEIRGASVLNNGFNASFTGGDNLSLFSASHPLQGGGTLSNILATAADLSETSLEEMLILISTWTDDRGIPLSARAIKLIIPPQLRFIAQRILKSDFRPGTGDNDINAVKSLGEMSADPAVNHRLTDPDAWFIKTDIPDGLKHFVRKAVSRGVEGHFETGNVRYKARERYSFGWSNWRGAAGTPGAG
jgi:hypothetical protein